MIQKLLLIGPCPPPHGGVSVHVWNARALTKRSGIECKVLNIDRRAPPSDAYVKISGGGSFLKELLEHAYNDWTLHMHTNGHNTKSWILALACGAASQIGPGGMLTLHSGMLPAFLKEGGLWRRLLARLTCALYRRIVCVSQEIADTLESLGVPRRSLDVAPAYLPVPVGDVAIPPAIQDWMKRHSTVLTSTMFFRPEYGFELLVEALAQLKKRYSRIGCIVFGSGEDRAAAEALIQKERLGDTMLLAGDVHHDLCLALMARSSVFIRPTYNDGDSISVREALSFGIPVVASNVGTRPSGVLLFEPGDLNGLIAQVEKVLQ